MFTLKLVQLVCYLKYSSISPEVRCFQQRFRATWKTGRVLHRASHRPWRRRLRLGQLRWERPTSRRSGRDFLLLGKPCKNTCFFNILKGYPDVFVVFCLIEKVYIFNDMSTLVLDSRWFVFSEMPTSCWNRRWLNIPRNWWWHWETSCGPWKLGGHGKTPKPMVGSWES